MIPESFLNRVKSGCKEFDGLEFARRRDAVLELDGNNFVRYWNES